MKMGRIYAKQFGNTKIPCGCNRRKLTIRPSFFQTEDELDYADKLAFQKYRKNGYDDLTPSQKRTIRQIIKSRRGKGIFE